MNCPKCQSDDIFTLEGDYGREMHSVNEKSTGKTDLTEEFNFSDLTVSICFSCGHYWNPEEAEENETNTEAAIEDELFKRWRKRFILLYERGEFEAAMAHFFSNPNRRGAMLPIDEAYKQLKKDVENEAIFKVFIAIFLVGIIWWVLSFL